MRIKCIEVENFKCFDHLNMELNDFNVLIGKNASGKSNVINILKFVKDILSEDLEDAIDLQGGISYLYNSKNKSSKNIKINISFDFSKEMIINRFPFLAHGEYDSRISVYELNYMLDIKPYSNGNYSINKESIKIYYIKSTIKDNDRYLNEINEKENGIKLCQIITRNSQNKVDIKFQGDWNKELKNDFKNFSKYYEAKIKLDDDSKKIILKDVVFINFGRSNLEDFIKIYDFNPKTLKNVSIINRKNNLEEDGSNIANVLHRILSNRDSKKELLCMLNRLMPFIKDISTEKTINKSMYFKVKENNENDLPSILLSDGTVNLIAIIIALYFDKNGEVIVIEEPEKNIHPRLANDLIFLMKEICNKKQIIVTTHNTYIMDNVDIDDIFYVYRNKNNTYSEIQMPKNNPNIKEYIKNDLGIGDIYYNSLFVDEEE